MFRLFVSLLLLVLAAGSLTAQKPGKSELKMRRAIIKEWQAVAELAESEGDREIGLRAVSAMERYATQADRDRLEKLREEFEDLDEGSSSPAVATREAEAKKRVLAQLDKLSKVRTGKAGQGRIDAYLLRACELEGAGDKRKKKLRKLVKNLSRREPERCRRLLLQVRRVDREGVAEGKYLAIEAALARSDYLLVSPPDHPLQAIVMLPKKWKKTGKYPIAVYIDGAGCVFLDAAQAQRDQAGSRDFILVVPITFSNANDLVDGKHPYDADLIERFRSFQTRPSRMEWDVEGLKGVLSIVKQEFGGEAGYLWTCYSGGGFLSYWWLHHHPGEIRAFAAASANYDPQFGRGGVTELKDGRPPIRLFTGSTDSAGPPRIFPQSDQALEVFRKLGSRDIERVHLKGRGHERFSRLVYEFFEAKK